MTQRIDQRLDVTGLNCPLPLLKAKQALNRLPADSYLEVVATDPGSERDFQIFVKQSSYQLLRQWHEAEFIHHLLYKP